MQLKTEVEIPNYDFRIDYKQLILSLGSCFAVNIGEKIKQNGIYIDINPFGNLYNPISIADRITDIIAKKKYVENDFFFYNNLWNCFKFSSALSDNNLSSTITKINKKIESLNKFLSNCDYLFVTFGTAFVFEEKEKKEIVSNCHKQAANIFNYYLLSVEQIVDKWSDLIKKIQNDFPKLQIIFTISPVKYFKDSIISNNRSKSTLTLSTQILCEKFSKCDYFPAFEIINEELRDYRFFASDMQHISEIAVEYIWEIFQKNLFNEKTVEFMKEMQKINLAMEHRAIFPQSEEYKNFCKQQIKKISIIEKKYKLNLFDKIDYFQKK